MAVSTHSPAPIYFALLGAPWSQSIRRLKTEPLKFICQDRKLGKCLLAAVALATPFRPGSVERGTSLKARRRLCPILYPQGAPLLFTCIKIVSETASGVVRRAKSRFPRMLERAEKTRNEMDSLEGSFTRPRRRSHVRAQKTGLSTSEIDRIHLSKRISPRSTPRVVTAKTLARYATATRDALSEK